MFVLSGEGNGRCLLTMYPVELKSCYKEQLLQACRTVSPANLVWCDFSQKLVTKFVLIV